MSHNTSDHLPGDPGIELADTSGQIDHQGESQHTNNTSEVVIIPADNTKKNDGGHTNVTIAYKNVSSIVQVSKVDQGPSTVLSAVTSLFKPGNKRDLYRLKDVSGTIKPGQMTMVISPPGHGKSTFLQTLSARSMPTRGQIVFNGQTSQQAQANNIDLKKMLSFVSQTDLHLPLFTVHETLTFANQMGSIHYTPEYVDKIIHDFGLDECRNTIIGDHMVRGVSGGQRRRVSIAEGLLSDACSIFLDEYSNGLDSAITEKIGEWLLDWTRRTNGSVVCTLQQPSPKLFSLFDRIIILNEGEIIYDGPQVDVIPYFEGLGFTCPHDVDACDFIVDVISHPHIALQQVQRAEKQVMSRQIRRAQRKGLPMPTPPKKSPTVMTSFGPLQRSNEACLRPEQMIEYYQSTKLYSNNMAEVEHWIPSSSSSTAPINPDLPPIVTPYTLQHYPTDYRQPLSVIFKFVLSRQWKLQVRNKIIMFTRLFNSLFMIFIASGLFYQIPMDQYTVRMASFTGLVAQTAFSNMSELPIHFSQKASAKAQRLLYPTWVLVISSWICNIPLLLFESILFSQISYWMMGHTASFVPWLVYFLLLFVSSNGLSAFFKLAVGYTPNLSFASSISALTSNIMIVLSGFLVQPKNLRVWIRWLYWLSPFAWAVRGLANNEYHASRYDNLIINAMTGKLERAGDVYLAYSDVRDNQLWILWAFVFMICLAVGCNLLYAWLLDSPAQSSIGTRRFSGPDDISHLEPDDDVLNKAAVLQHQVNESVLGAAPPSIIAPITQTKKSAITQNTTTTHGNDEPSISQSVVNSLLAETMATSGGALRTLTEKLPFTPTWLSWSNVKYTVKVPAKDGNGMVDRILLDGVSGYAEPGKLIALMGASGAGKTTLLDVLSNRKNTGVIQGTILLNGEIPTAQHFATITSYVEQFETLYAFDTVYEALRFAAYLRLPPDVSTQVKDAVVEEVMNILDLTSIRNFMVGSPQMPGLSPAQSKRLNIGIELVGNPSILFLDEPTTGLDSKSAQTVMRAIKRISRSGRSVVCTIHQPSAELFFFFDRLLLLHSGGHQMFFGDLGNRATSFIKYLSTSNNFLIDNNNIDKYLSVATMRAEEQQQQGSTTTSKSTSYDDSIIQLSNDLRDNGIIQPLPLHQNPATWMLVELAKEYNDTQWNNIITSYTQFAYGPDSTIRPSVSHDTFISFPQNLQLIHLFKTLYFNSTVWSNSEMQLNRIEFKYRRDNNLLTESEQAEIASNPALGTDSQHTFSQLKDHIYPSLWTQFTLLLYRSNNAYWRNPALCYGRQLWLTISLLLYGIIYLRVEVNSIPTLIGFMSALVMSLTTILNNCCATAIPLMLGNRPVFYRERQSAFYYPIFWCITVTIADTLWCLPSIIEYMTIIYFMVGGAYDAGIYFKSFLTVFIACAIYISFAFMVSMVSPNQGIGMLAMGLFFGVSINVNGINRAYKTLSGFYKFLYHLLPSGKITESLTMMQTSKLTDVMTVVLNGQPVVDSINNIAETYTGIGSNVYWAQFGWLILTLAVLQIASIIFAYTINHAKR